MLTELGEMMHERGISASKAKTENFGELLEILCPASSRASDKDKRRLLRDLLLNAVDLPPSDPKWESARLAAGLLSVLAPPALAILAALAHVGARGSTTANLTRTGDTGQIELEDQSENPVALHYHWFVLEQAYRSISANQPRLVIAGSHGRDVYQKLALTEIGDFLLEWSTAKSIGDSQG